MKGGLNVLPSKTGDRRRRGNFGYTLDVSLRRFESTSVKMQVEMVILLTGTRPPWAYIIVDLVAPNIIDDSASCVNVCSTPESH